MANQNNYQVLISKLDQFIRKFYFNKLLRGVLYSIGLVLGLFLAVTILEHYFYFSTSIRKTFFFSFLGVTAVAIGYWVLLPLLNYFSLGRTISHEKAAVIIGDHFTDVQDKLLNILQLNRQSEQASENDLILASINQKSDAIKLVPFKKAINLNQNRKYLWLALPPLALLVVLLSSSDLIESSTNRLINNGQEFERPAPFSFKVMEEDLTVVQYEDFDINVKVEGDVLPNEVFIEVDNYQFKLMPDATRKDVFSYKFKNVQKKTAFKLLSGTVLSKGYEIDVLSKPNITGFEIDLIYPSYTGRTNETFANIGDLVVPAGTRATWAFNAKYTDEILMKFGSGKEKAGINRVGQENFNHKKSFYRDDNYTVYVSNEFLPLADSVKYSVTVIPDLNPSIKVKQFVDSADVQMIYFAGEASDDYGIKSLTFNYQIQSPKGSLGQLSTLPMNFKQGTATGYDYNWDLRILDLKPGAKLTYYFEVFDNDGVNGSKSSRTGIMNYALASLEEMEEEEQANNEEIKDALSKSKEEAEKIKKEMKKLREKLLQKKEMDWQDKKELEKLLERQKELEKEIEKAKQNFQENLENQEEFSKPKEELMEKQEKVEKMFEELMSPEMKELMQKMEDLMQEMDKDKAMEELQEAEMNDEQLEMELDRMLEMFKQLEFERDMEKAIDDLKELAKEQEELSEKTEEQKESPEELKKEQEEIEEKFEKIQEKLEDLEKKNEEMEFPNEMDDTKEQEEEIQEEMEDSKEQLEKKDNGKASDAQKKAGQKMGEMADAMAAAMESGEMEQMEEDMEALRQLLENLVNLSFDQEKLMEEVTGSIINTPHYVGLVQDQYKIKDDFKLVEDSLQALSKRVFQIETFVTEKVGEVKNNIRGSLKFLEDRNKQKATVDQQFSMKGLNDLALMLSEVMEQMQQQMAAMMAGSQTCQKPGKAPGKGKPSMSKMQQQLNDQLTKMQQEMKGKGKGNKGKGGESSKGFAEAAKKQAALRNALRELQKENQQQGKGGNKQLQEMIDQMDKTETDLVNKRLTNQMLKRQEEILTRLMEHEKAERQRQYDNKREARSATEIERKMPPELEEYLKKRDVEIEMYKTVSPELKPYYKFLVEEYFKTLKEN